eukprot:CAMPEP_0117756824 /NCGR_PEP_ID=MMETSP0947-20121206/14334_1 /TAXON_ID=44440 /ORGANISM="Chattonella subsalsa, Strain CCMP2191" /LENGTH=162 /DNA_ID=CAMNT_0005576537 /DNA_START=269 /DNA_END=757 /DNA_ORIENTATION=+
MIAIWEKMCPTICTSLFRPSSQKGTSLLGTILGGNVQSMNQPVLNQLQNRNMASFKHKKIIKMAKGYRGRANRCFRVAINRVEKALQYSYRDRKVKKREMRKLWIERINAGARQHGMKYSNFIYALSCSDIELNRKVLADLAMNEPYSFKSVVDTIKCGAQK